MKPLTLAISMAALMSASVNAQDSRSRGVALGLSVGVPQVMIVNPDGTDANYTGLGLIGKLRFPLIEEKMWGVDLFGSGQYLDLKNTSNTDDRQEVAQMIGPGLGLELRFTRFLAGIDYNHIMARHIGVGPISGTLEYEMRVLNYYAGIAWQFGALSLSLSYSMASGEVPTSATGFEKASAYSDKIIWINFRYATGESLSNIGKSIVKN